VIGSPWLPACVAALMLLVAACCAARLILSRLHRRHSEPHSDVLHGLMGVAMAGMLQPRLSPVPPAAWLVVFGLAAAWFSWESIRSRWPAKPATSQGTHPGPHVVECAAMVYMLWPTPPGGHDHASSMPGMSALASAPNPALALVLSLFMLGYILWITDQLAAARRSHVTAGRAATDSAVSATAGGSALDAIGDGVLAPGIAAVSKITMSAAMAYMLVAMI